MTAISTRLNESTDSLLRFAMRADAVLTGLAGIAALPLAGWLSSCRARRARSSTR